MPTIIITSEKDCEHVEVRIRELAGCLEGTPEERELLDHVLALEIWDTKHRAG